MKNFGVVSKKKEIMAFLLTMVIIAGVCTTSYATTPSYKPLSGYGYTGVPEINTDNIELPDAVKEAISRNVKEKVKNLDIKLLTTPQITENRYIHGRAFWDKNRLQVRWDTVDEATSYEIIVKKKDGTEKTYMSSYAALVVNENDDAFITGCIMGGTVKIRAVKDDGALYSLWTEEDTIACNKVFR